MWLLSNMILANDESWPCPQALRVRRGGVVIAGYQHESMKRYYEYLNTEDTLSGFQECFLQPVIKDRSNKVCIRYNWWKLHMFFSPHILAIQYISLLKNHFIYFFYNFQIKTRENNTIWTMILMRTISCLRLVSAIFSFWCVYFQSLVFYWTAWS